MSKYLGPEHRKEWKAAWNKSAKGLDAMRRAVAYLERALE